MRNTFKVFTVTLIMIMGFLFPLNIVSASGNTGGDNLICTVFPFLKNVQGFGISNICNPNPPTGETVSGVRNLIQFGLSLVFVGIIIISIYIIIKAALKYIQSEGEEAKIEAASKAIKSVFIGIAALFIGIIGILIVLAFFNAAGAVQNADDNGVPLIPQLLP